jgi:hypothetical protein
VAAPSRSRRGSDSSTSGGDKDGEGLASVAEVSYWYESGSAWKWSKRNVYV